ncbi:FAD-binding oxidoreductase [Aestuariivita sp.]|jgi:glycine/D-amino acid oxidase-like deaminating enzyme|uniref:NAD(P)/FAD-dependent oxidoreductase n=1 Tax=Aestuariivita sp. TaxID=1872407 RepID=UPI00216EEC66|nr:FAD-binding oxidoreductase [Aestuariivita sp.]MCE8008173.1 FAD-binding oxidoreductase [Aestuariivita sp.]
MRRIYSDYAYGPGPRTNCFWDESALAFDWPEMDGDARADLCIIGAGFTGVNAAISAAQSGAAVIVLEAETPGWGASGRNGGFCCLGGGLPERAKLTQRFGEASARAYHNAELSAVSHVADLLSTYGIDADVHSDGETQLAHKPSRMGELEASARDFERTYGKPARILRAADLAEAGLDGPFHGAVSIPTGFALNPRKYIDGILQVARDLGVRIMARSPATGLSRQSGEWHVVTPKGTVRADKALIATNGYSSEDLPDWMAARYMPTQSTIVVTRPLTGDEIQAQGWTSQQMSYDTRHLLHYFRLMPDNRFLIGMRGGLTATPGSEARARANVRKNLAQMFPAWAEVEITHQWSGMVCLSPKFLPFAGEVPEHPGLLAGFAYHGNGVAMASYMGHLLGRLAVGERAEIIPDAIRADPGRFPLGRARRAVMPPAYARFWLQDL